MATGCHLCGRWRGGRRDGSARTRRKVLISAQVATAAATLFLESSCRSGRRCLVDTPGSPVPEQPAPNLPAGTRVCPPNSSPNLYRSGTSYIWVGSSCRSAPSTRPGPGCPARPVWKSTSASGAPDNSSLSHKFLGDDMAVPAPSGGEEPAPSRYRAGAASMAWRVTL